MDKNRHFPWVLALVLAGVVVLLNLGWFAWLAIECAGKGGSC